MAHNEIHVRIRGGLWCVFRAGDDVPQSTHDRKIDAVAAARQLAARDDAELVVYTLDGKPQ